MNFFQKRAGLPLKIARNSKVSPVFDFEMKANESHDNRLEARLDENDPVWLLLGESPRPKPDAWFAVRTLARCRYAGAGTESHRFFLGGLWRWKLGGGLGLCLAVALMAAQIPAPSPAVNKQQKVQEAFEIMANLDSPDEDSSSSSTDSDSSL
jgi:hypothetical protein